MLANNAQAAVDHLRQLHRSMRLWDRVDGRYASTTGDIRIVMGSKSYSDAGQVYRNTSVDRTALDRLIELTGGVRVSAHVPAVASNKQNAIVRLGLRRDYVAPIWNGISIIAGRDFTKAASGGVVLTAVMLAAQKLTRAGGFYKQQIDVS